MANKHLHIGVGGKKCVCCFPPAGSRDRRAQFRSAKRKADRASKREIENQILEEKEASLELILQENDFYESYYDEYESAYDAYESNMYEESLRETRYEREMSFYDYDYYMD